ncbi:MAG: mandelate racemase/muconate lactonizing enzyme family protein [Bacilli bacterium]
MSIAVHRTVLPMTRSFATAGGVVGDVAAGAPHLYVKVTDEAGRYGWGEARPSPRWSYETPESVQAAVQHYLAPTLIGLSVADLQAIDRVLDQVIASGLDRGQPIAKAAIDIALHDLLGKQLQRNLSELWYAAPQGSVALSYLIATSSAAEAAALTKQAREDGYRGLDVKVGKGLRSDMAVLEAVKQEAGDLFIRADANQGYRLQEAVRMGQFMAQLGVDILEQPLPAGDLLGHAALRCRVDVPIALDESIWTAAGCVQAIRLAACDAIVVKVTKMGGLKAAKLCAEVATAAGLALLGGGLTESRLGLFASAHLFHSLGVQWPVDLNGPFFLKDDPVVISGAMAGGAVVLGPQYGTGCDIDSDKLALYTK